MRLLQWFGEERRCRQLVIFAAKSRLGLCPQTEEYLTGFLQAAQAFSHGSEGNAIGDMLIALPGGTYPADEATTRHDVHRGGHLGDHGRVPIRIAHHQGADAHALRRQSQARQGCPALQRVVHWIARIGHEMIRDTCRVPASSLNVLPQGLQLWPGNARGAGKQTKAHDVTPCSYSDASATCTRAPRQTGYCVPQLTPP